MVWQDRLLSTIQTQLQKKLTARYVANMFWAACEQVLTSCCAMFHTPEWLYQHVWLQDSQGLHCMRAGSLLLSADADTLS